MTGSSSASASANAGDHAAGPGAESVDTSDAAAVDTPAKGPAGILADAAVADAAVADAAVADAAVADAAVAVPASIALSEGALSASAVSDGAVSDGAKSDGAKSDDAFGLEEPVLVVPRGLVWVTLAALAITVGLSILYAPAALPSEQPSLELNLWPGQPWELQEMRTRASALTQKYPPHPAQEQRLRGDLLQWLTRDAEQGSLAAEHDLAARLLLSSAEEQVRTLVLTRGEDAFQAMATRYGVEVRAQLEAALAALPESGRDLHQLAGNPRGAAVERLAPGLLTTLRGTGIHRLMAGQTLSLAGQLVVEALATHRMLELGTRLSSRPSLPTDVQALLLRWRVEAHEGLSDERRLQLLAQLSEMDPGYPAEFTAGVLAARANDCATAVQAWRRAAAKHQEPSRTRANLRWCIKRLQSPPRD